MGPLYGTTEGSLFLAILRFRIAATAGSADVPFTARLTIARSPVLVTVASPERALLGFIWSASTIGSAGDVTVSAALPVVIEFPVDLLLAVNDALENRTTNTTTAAITPPASSRTRSLVLLPNAGRRAVSGTWRAAMRCSGYEVVAFQSN